MGEVILKDGKAVEVSLVEKTIDKVLSMRQDGESKTAEDLSYAESLRPIVRDLIEHIDFGEIKEAADFHRENIGTASRERRCTGIFLAASVGPKEYSPQRTQRAQRKDLRNYYQTKKNFLTGSEYF